MAIGVHGGGGDTATPRNMGKRLELIGAFFPLDGARVLDCGCGEGSYVEAMLELGADAYGMEVDPEKVARSPLLHTERIVRGDIESLPYADGSFDLVILNEVLEHVPDQESALSEVRRVLKAKGRFILFAPNRCYPFESHGLYMRRSGHRLPPYVPGVPYVPEAIGKRIFRYWARNYWPWQLSSLCRAAGFAVVSHTFVWQTFENISGVQPSLVRKSKPLLRRISALGEKLPVVQRLGLSQLLVCEPSSTISST